MVQQNSSPHLPVLLEEVVELSNLSDHPSQVLDATFGRGGHTKVLLQRFLQAKVTGIDQDSSAIEFGRQYFKDELSVGRLTLRQTNFVDYLASANSSQFDFILADLGVSSPQLDNAERGFSFYQQGPLDMRMNAEGEVTAADVVNQYTEDELIKVFQSLGEVRRPFRVVRALVHDRKQNPFTTTTQLSSLIERVDGWRKKGSHPATKYFLALRMAVNGELDVVEKSLENFVRCLRPGGRLAIITFHSLEDRIVKHGMRSLKSVCPPVNKKVIVATKQEQSRNVRSRSAKLRVYQKNQEGE